MLTAVIFPANPEASVFDLTALTDQMRAAIKRGARLYTNGRQFALLPHPVRGWHPFAAGPRQPKPQMQGDAPCRA